MKSRMKFGLNSRMKQSLSASPLSLMWSTNLDSATADSTSKLRCKRIYPRMSVLTNFALRVDCDWAGWDSAWIHLCSHSPCKEKSKPTCNIVQQRYGASMFAGFAAAAPAHRGDPAVEGREPSTAGAPSDHGTRRLRKHPQPAATAEHRQVGEVTHIECNQQQGTR